MNVVKIEQEQGSKRFSNRFPTELSGILEPSEYLTFITQCNELGKQTFPKFGFIGIATILLSMIFIGIGFVKGNVGLIATGFILFFASGVFLIVARVTVFRKAKKGIEKACFDATNQHESKNIRFYLRQEEFYVDSYEFNNFNQNNNHGKFNRNHNYNQNNGQPTKVADVRFYIEIEYPFASESSNNVNQNNQGPNYGNQNNGGQNYGNQNNGGQNYGNPNNGPNYGNQNNGGQNYGNPNNGAPNYGNQNNGGQNYGNPNNGVQNYGNQNNV